MEHCQMGCICLGCWTDTIAPLSRLHSIPRWPSSSSCGRLREEKPETIGNLLAFCRQQSTGFNSHLARGARVVSLVPLFSPLLIKTMVRLCARASWVKR